MLWLIGSSAYEISSYWHETPPPPEILENLTAKGGDLRNRTLENFQAPGSRESGIPAEGLESADDEQRTPKADAMDVDEPGSAGRYPTRQLRQDPKKTQLFQPDLASTRQRYNRTTSPQASPAPVQHHYTNASADPRNPMFNLDNYQPKQPMALTLRPIVTPGNNPDVFRQRKVAEKISKMPRAPVEIQHFLRGTIPNNMSGPNIYIRCLYGLRSGIPEEQDFALHHLVKVSFERGDKYKFEGFPLLAESLLEKALEITELLYDVKWEISYDQDADLHGTNTLNGSYCTPRLLSKVRSLEVKIKAEDVETEQFSHRLDKLNEAALVIRNMVILEENAAFVSRFPLLREFLIIAINLPDQPRLTEYRHYALEIAEQVTRYYELSSDDALYMSLLEELNHYDRGNILPAMRAIIRISMETPTLHRLTDIPVQTIERVVSYLLLEVDDELTSASLDFLYQYTALSENLDLLLRTSPTLLSSLTTRLSNLLLHSARPFEERIMVRAAQKQAPNTTIAVIPQDLYEELLKFPEPERSSKWLKCCFEESAADDITQIAIWQAYQGRFHDNSPIPAAEFIKNVSNTFSTAQAQVINGPQPRFIIKGIRPRRVLIDLKGIPQLKCQWEVPAKSEPTDLLSRLPSKQACGQWQSSRQKLWEHILSDHLLIPRKEDGSFSAKAMKPPALPICRWSGCMRNPEPMKTPRDIGLHVRLHIPETSTEPDTAKQSDVLKEPEFTRHTFYSTPVDDKNVPAGVGWTSIAVMRNLARYANRQQFQSNNNKTSLMEELFGHVKREMWYNVSVSRTLMFWVNDLMKLITKSEIVGQAGSSHSSEESKEVEMG